jgi:hypothetical protein
MSLGLPKKEQKEDVKVTAVESYGSYRKGEVGKSAAAVNLHLH